MGVKLFKHEFLRTRGVLGAIFGLCLLLALTALVTANVPGLSQLAFVGGVVATLAVIPATQIYLAIHLYRSTFGRQGYFTNAIPVPARTVLGVKYVYALVMTFAALAVALASAWVCGRSAAVQGSDVWAEGWTAVGALWREYPGQVGLFIVLFLLSLAAYLAQYYFSVVVGSEPWIRRSGALGPVVTYILVYIGLQVAALLGLVLPPTVDIATGEFTWLMPIAALERGDSGLPLWSAVSALIISAVLLWRALRGPQRRLELR